MHVLGVMARFIQGELTRIISPLVMWKVKPETETFVVMPGKFAVGKAPVRLVALRFVSPEPLPVASVLSIESLIGPMI